MPQISIDKSYDTGEAPTEEAIDALRDGLLNFFNVIKVGTDNLQDDTAITAKIAASAVTTAKLNELATADFAAGSVTKVKQAVVSRTTNGTDPGEGGLVMASAMSSNFSSSSATWATLSNQSVSVTTKGRPVRLVVLSSATGGGVGGVTAGASVPEFRFTRDGSAIRTFQYSSGSPSDYYPSAALQAYDNPAAGTYTYALQGRTSGGSPSAIASGVKLVAYEL